MNGPKYSYSAGATDRTGDSTVVALKDGSLLEVRRGAQTRWGAGEARQRWANLEEWMATLPAEAMIKKSGCWGGGPRESRPAAPPMSPEMARILEALQRAGARTCPTLGKTKTRAERITELQNRKKHAEKNLSELSSADTDARRARRARARIQSCEWMLSNYVQRIPEASKPVILNSGRFSRVLLARNNAGQLQRLYFNGRRGLFGIRKNGKIQVAPTLAELGFPVEPELWLSNPWEETQQRLTA